MKELNFVDLSHRIEMLKWSKWHSTIGYFYFADICSLTGVGFPAPW